MEERKTEKALQTREQTDQSCCVSDANFYYITAFRASHEFLCSKLHFHMCSVDFRRMAAHSALWKEAKKDKIFLGEFSEAIYLSHLTLIKSYHAFSSCLYLFCHCMHQFIFQRGNWTPFIIILLKNVTVLHCTTILLKLIYACSIDNKEAGKPLKLKTTNALKGSCICDSGYFRKLKANYSFAHKK